MKNHKLKLGKSYLKKSQGGFVSSNYQFMPGFNQLINNWNQAACMANTPVQRANKYSFLAHGICALVLQIYQKFLLILAPHVNTITLQYRHHINPRCGRC